MKTYYSQFYSDCSDDNPLAADIRNSFIRNFRNPNEQYEYEDESEDEWDGVGSCVDDGCPLCWPNHVCSPRKVPSNLTDSVIRLVIQFTKVLTRESVFRGLKFTSLRKKLSN